MRVYRRAHIGVEGQFEHHGKGTVYTDADGWHKKALGAECSTEIPTNVGPVSIVHNQDHYIHAGASGMTKTSLSANNEGGESLAPILDSSDTQAQVIYCLNTFLGAAHLTFM